MARLTAYTPVNNSSTGNLLGLTYDSLTTTRYDAAGMSWNYTRYGASVMDIDVNGTFLVSDYNASGTFTGLTVWTPSARPAVVIDGFTLSFSNLYELSLKMDFNSLFSGADQLIGSWGNDVLSGRGGNDVIWGMDGNDSVSGGSGADEMNGNQGNDTLDGGDGNDTVYGGRDVDQVYGGTGDDIVNGNMANDIVHGNGGNDSVYGGQNEDFLFGDDGNDLLSGDLGNDTLYGGAGADTFWFRAGAGADVIADFNRAEGDRVRITAGLGYSIGSDGMDGLIVLSEGSVIRITGAAGRVTDDWIVTG